MPSTQALEQQLEDVRTRVSNLLHRTQQQAEAENRAFTATERSQIQKLLDEAKRIKAQVDSARGDADFTAELNRLTAGMLPASPTTTAIGDPRRGVSSLGAMVLHSEMGRWLLEHRGKFPAGTWTSPSSELPYGPGMFAATLTEDTASGGDLVITDYRRGILPSPTRPPRLADLIPSETTDSNSVSYMKETTFTNAAAPVAEAGTKPESTLVFDLVNDLVVKIAHWIPATEEILEDVPSLRAYIDARLRLGVLLAEEDQLLNGNGTAPNMRGILNRSGLATPQARGTDTNADAIKKQITNITTTMFEQPTGVVIHPTNWQTIELAKDANGQYYGDGPFRDPGPPTLWGLPVVPTSVIASGTALVGVFTQARIFRKGGMRVEASNSHSTFFVENKIAIRAEVREALAVFRPGSFGTVTGLV